MYRYRLPFALRGVRCVGWLDNERAFATGNPSVGLAEKLDEIIHHRSDVFDVHVNVVRGTHPCNFCGKDVKLVASGRETLLGMSEIWIPDNVGWLASPSLIAHYITEHGYLPPSSFEQALRELSTRDRFLGQEVYDRLVSEITAG